MRKTGIAFGTALGMAAGSLLLTACSAGNEGEGKSGEANHLSSSLCATKISTGAVGEMYPGPYSSVEMRASKNGGINAVDGTKGQTDGDCDVWITQKKGNAEALIAVLVRAEPGTAEGLYERRKNYYPTHPMQQLTLGSASGYTTDSDAVLTFDCQTPDKQSPMRGTLGVSVTVLVSDQSDEVNVERPRLTKQAAKLAADAARYVNSSVLKCTGPGLPAGAPDRKPVGDSWRD